MHTSLALEISNAYIYIYISSLSFILHFLLFQSGLFFPENDLASSAVCCAPSAVVCIHRLRALYKPCIYIYYIYIYISFCLFYFSVSKIELLIIFSGKRSREFRCALRTERCRLHTSPACTLNYCIYVYILYISFCLFYFTVSKIELLIIFFRKTISRVPLCAAHRALSFAYAGRSIYIYICVCVCLCNAIYLYSLSIDKM